MFLIVAWLLFLFCIFCSIFEAIEDRRWPQETFRFVVMSGLVLAMFY